MWSPEFQFRVRQTQVEGFGKVIDQCPATPLVPSTCRRTEQTEFQSLGLRQVGQSMEYGGQRSEVERSKSKRERGDRLGVWSLWKSGVLRE